MLFLKINNSKEKDCKPINGINNRIIKQRWIIRLLYEQGTVPSMDTHKIYWDQ